MKVLIACEFSGIVREAFKAKGHDAWSCDLLDTEIPGQHIKDDINYHLISVGDYYYDLIIAHPPCTYLTNSGVHWLKNADGGINQERYMKMRKACDFFKQFRYDADRVAIENPIPHKYAKKHIGNYNQIIQPWQYGHGETKATCLWLRGLPKLIPTNIVDDREARVHKEPPGPDRWKNRSRTFQGIAEAMANQWGGEHYTLSKSFF